ncbi:DUF3618 domain-containing protein [Sphaerisporangium aureirubrum]|uniref:DUF3618 domain-containing protein n=1 Tax=Sphaerisporangium aureirubrum TaxID=1544736 RepID=A0ABW1NPZ9_9ACTN
MSEIDPVGASYRPTAGEVGLHRQEPGTATPESAGPSLNVPRTQAPHKPYVKPVVSHGRGDPLAGLSGSPAHPSEPGTGPQTAGIAGRTGQMTHDGRLSEEDRLREEIAQTREDLGRTVEALAGKADVKARARRTMAAAKSRLTGRGTARRRAAGMSAGTASGAGGRGARDMAAGDGAGRGTAFRRGDIAGRGGAARDRVAELAARLRGGPPATTRRLGDGQVDASAFDRAGSMADRVIAQAARHPLALIAAGATSVAAATWSSWARSRVSTARRRPARRRTLRVPRS